MLSCIQLFVTSQTVACQVPLSMGLSKKDTGVGSHCLLQGIFPIQGSNHRLLHCRQIFFYHWATGEANALHEKWKSLSPVRLFATPWTIYSPLGSSVHGILQARILEWVAISFSRDLPNTGIEARPPALQMDSLPSEPRSPRILEWVAYPLSRGSSGPTNWTRFPYNAGGFFPAELPGNP